MDQMETIIQARDLRSSLSRIVEEVGRGAKFTVVYRGRPAFRIVPINSRSLKFGDLEHDTLYRAPAVGRSTAAWSGVEHDVLLYPK